MKTLPFLWLTILPCSLLALPLPDAQRDTQLPIQRLDFKRRRIAHHPRIDVQVRVKPLTRQYISNLYLANTSINDKTSARVIKIPEKEKLSIPQHTRLSLPDDILKIRDQQIVNKKSDGNKVSLKSVDNSKADVSDVDGTTVDSDKNSYQSNYWSNLFRDGLDFLDYDYFNYIYETELARIIEESKKASAVEKKEDETKFVVNDLHQEENLENKLGVSELPLSKVKRISQNEIALNVEENNDAVENKQEKKIVIDISTKDMKPKNKVSERIQSTRSESDITNGKLIFQIEASEKDLLKEYEVVDDRNKINTIDSIIKFGERTPLIVDKIEENIDITSKIIDQGVKNNVITTEEPDIITEIPTTAFPDNIIEDETVAPVFLPIKQTSIKKLKSSRTRQPKAVRELDHPSNILNFDHKNSMRLKDTLVLEVSGTPKTIEISAKALSPKKESLKSTIAASIPSQKKTQVKEKPTLKKKSQTRTDFPIRRSKKPKNIIPVYLRRQLGTNPHGSHPFGLNPFGQFPLGQSPLGVFPLGIKATNNTTKNSSSTPSSTTQKSPKQTSPLTTSTTSPSISSSTSSLPSTPISSSSSPSSIPSTSKLSTIELSTSKPSQIELLTTQTLIDDQSQSTRIERMHVQVRKPDGSINGDYIVQNHDTGSLSGVRYDAVDGADQELIQKALKEFLSLGQGNGLKSLAKALAPQTK